MTGEGASPSGHGEFTDGAVEGGGEYVGDSEVVSKRESAHEVARMVYTFVASANVFTEEMDKSDEVKLLRLRTRKNEIVIVPGRAVSSNAYSVPLMVSRSKVPSRRHPRYSTSLNTDFPVVL